MSPPDSRPAPSRWAAATSTNAAEVGVTEADVVGDMDESTACGLAMGVCCAGLETTGDLGAMCVPAAVATLEAVGVPAAVAALEAVGVPAAVAALEAVGVPAAVAALEADTLGSVIGAECDGSGAFRL